MKAALIVAIVLAGIAALVELIDHPYSTRLTLALLSGSLIAFEAAHWPGLKP